MFDVGLFELIIIGGVGLLVIGPERLPGTIRTCFLWAGRIKQNLLDTRREIEKSIGADEIKQQLRNEKIMAELERLKETRDEIERDLLQTKSELEALPNQSSDDNHDEDHDDDHDFDDDEDYSYLDDDHDDDDDDEYFPHEDDEHSNEAESTEYVNDVDDGSPQIDASRKKSQTTSTTESPQTAEAKEATNSNDEGTQEESEAASNKS